jgi:hypothetical protein
MHFLTVVLLPQEEVPREEGQVEEGQLYEALHHLLAPYDRNLEPEGPIHKEYYDARTIEKFAALYGIPPAHLPEIAARLSQEWGVDVGVDELGLYDLTTLNPNRKFDYWIVRNMETDIWPVRDMPRDLLPVAVVTPDGHWHDMGAEWRPGDLIASEKQAIGQRAYSLIDQYPECQAVALDCHA